MRICRSPAVLAAFFSPLWRSIAAAVLAAVLFSAVYAANPLPLAAGSAGKTNHPVVFVHGINEGSTVAWDIVPDVYSPKIEKAAAGAAITKCRTRGGMEYWKVYAGLGYDVRIGSRVLTAQHTDVLIGTFYRALYPTAVLSAEYRTTADSLRVILKLSNGTSMVCNAAAGLLAKTRYTGMVQAPFQDPTVLDWVQSYPAGSTPAALATLLKLNTIPGTGINANGLYFYNAKAPDIKLVKLYGKVLWKGWQSQPKNRLSRQKYANWEDQLIAQYTVGGTVYYDIIVNKVNRMLMDSKAWAPVGHPVHTTNFEAITINDDNFYYRTGDDEPPIAYNWNTPANLQRLTGLAKVGTFPGWKISPRAPADYSTEPFSYGQPNQLYDRIVYALNSFYGRGNWENNPSAVVDIVGFSQGGLIARLMVSRYTGTTLANAVNHINRIVMVDVPNMGAAAATSPTTLKSKNAITGETYSALPLYMGKMLADTGSMTLSAGAKFDIPNQYYLIYGTATPSLSGTSWLGPYTFHVHTAMGFLGNGRADNYTYLDPLQSVRINLKDYFTYSQRMAWDSPFIQRMNTLGYPRNYVSGQPIPVVTLCSPGANGFFSTVYNEAFVVNGTYIWPKAQEMVKENLDNNTDARKFTETGAFAEKMVASIKNALNIKLADFKALDKDWAERSDIAIEHSSQTGVRGRDPYGWTPAGQYFGNPMFTTRDFVSSPNITHVDFGAKINAQLPGGMSPMLKAYRAATRQTSDIILSLVLGTPPPAETLPLAPSRTDLCPPAADTLWKPTGVVASTFDDTAHHCAKIRMQFVNGMGVALNKPLAQYYFVADRALRPRVTAVSPAGSVKLQQVKGALYRALVSGAVQIPSKTSWPTVPISFTLSYAGGSAWPTSAAPSADYSSAVPAHNKLIPLFDSLGWLAGSFPDTLASYETHIPASLVVSSMERDRSGLQLQPSLSVRNTGRALINNFTLRYFFRPEKAPRLSVYWMERMGNATVSLDSLGAGNYAVNIAYANVALKPGEEINNIDFELSNSDWSPWKSSDDSSYNNSPTLAPNWNIAAYGNDDGRVLWGNENLERRVMQGSALPVLEARDESLEGNVIAAHVRVRNIGTVALRGMVLRFPLWSAQEPVVYPQDTGALCWVDSGAVAGSWHVTVACRNVVLEPGEGYNAGFGLEIDIRSPDGSVLPKNPAFVRGTAWLPSASITVSDTGGIIIVEGGQD